MIKLLVQKTDNKFINNIELSNTDFLIKNITAIQNQLYKLFYTDNYTHFIFVASLLDSEVLQFIDEFGENTKIFIYNDTNFPIAHIKNIAGVLQKEKDALSQNKIIAIPKLVNNEVFYKNHYTKNSDIVSFLDNIDSLPDDLNKFLYPSSKLRIKLFNNQNIIHPQNLGILSEIDKAELLKKSEYYLALNNDYVPEAWACGCKVLIVPDLDSLVPTKHKNSKNFQSYGNFLKVILSDKK